MQVTEDLFRKVFDDAQYNVHQNARIKGFWSFQEKQIIRENESQEVLNLFASSKLALIHSEISEALEAIRHTTVDVIPKSDKIPPFTLIEEELADAVIRILDLAEFLELDISGAILAKQKMNQTRPFMHGKQL